MLKLVPVTEVKRCATEVIASLKKSHTAVMVTDRGREAAVMVDVDTWNSLQRRLQILDLAAKGVADLRAGRVTSQEDAKARLVRFAR
ncbi:MAG: type II toxin-antitoxin system Phd/YefM family antitoxin [Holophaga sp.]|nr:type II toxin-antitoxin system Phd/YefM family antitoxin [Holophaga sp.]